MALGIMSLFGCLALRNAVVAVVLLATMATTASAWTFVWTNTDGDSRIERGNDTRSCSEIDMERGGYYNWDPEDGDYCINMFADNRCDPSEQNGYSCPIWPDRNLGQDYVGSFLVNLDGEALPPVSSTATTSSLPVSSTSDSSTSTTSPPESSAIPAPQTSDDETDDGDSGSLSGGAIAGVVVGVIAGVAIICVFGFLAVKRRRNQQQQQRAPSVPPSDGPKPPSGVEEAPKYEPPPPELDSTLASPAAAQSPAPAYTPLPADKKDADIAYGSSRPPMSELADNTPVHPHAVELDAAEVRK